MRKQITQDLLVRGADALARRDSLESALTRRLPLFVQPIVSHLLSHITGLEPSTGGGLPSSEGRSIVRLFVLSALALAAMFAGQLAIPAALLLVHVMRQFSSVVGHHMTHRSPVSRGLRFAYDFLSALFLLPGFQAYQQDHRAHHAYVAGPDDPDQRFIAYLGARFDSPVRFLLTLLEPRFHARFLAARLKAVFRAGPRWRRAAAIAWLAVLAAYAPPMGLAAWAAAAILGFQAATLVQWSTEHLWNRRPAGAKAVEIAVAVTYGRLLLPDPAQPGLYPRLALYAAFRLLLVTGDLPNHDLHHLGRGPWVDHPHVRSRLILEGRLPIRQTTSLRAMFTLAFESARGAGPLPPRDMTGSRMLAM